MAKILLAAERKGGKISVRDAQLVFSQKFRPSAQVTKLWFSELVALGYGRVEKSRKSLIFQNTPRTVTVGDSCSENLTEFDLGTVTNAVTVGDSSYKSSLPTVTNCHQLSPETIQAPPLQEEGLKANVTNCHRFATSEKIENQNVSDCVKFIRTAISDNDPQSDRVIFQKN